MHRTSNSFNVLQAIAAVVALALVLWASGAPNFRLAEAAALTDFSNTLSDSAPGVGADQTIEFVAPNVIGGTAGEGIVITFPAGFDLSTIGEEDIDLLEDGTDENLGGGWLVATTSNTVSITSGGIAEIAAGATTTIRIGLNATSQVAGDSQIVNPVAGSYEIQIETAYDSDPGAGVTIANDNGETRVAIVDSVVVTAAVDTQFTFSVAGVAGGETVNDRTTGGPTTATAIPFGELEAGSGNASTAAQDLTVVTNASNGFVVTVLADQQLTASNGADIDGFRNGTLDSTPIAWESPTGVVGDEDTYGHWGVTTDDPTLVDADFAGTLNGGYVAVSTSTPVEIFRHDGPTNGSTTGEGQTRVGYRVEISALQEAATDYTATLTYVATPVF